MIENLPNEIWKDAGVINGFDFSGLYEISNMGRIKGCEKIVRGRKIEERILKRVEFDIKNGKKEEEKHAKIKAKMIRNLTSRCRPVRVVEKILQRKTNNSF